MSNEEYSAAVCAYKSAMAQTRRMLDKGIITEEEYAVIDTKMSEKYGLSSVSIYRENDLLYKENYGTMSPTKEVT